MSRRPMSAVDHAWYRMDSPTNLMMVHAIMWTDEPLDWDAVLGTIGRDLLDRFGKFRQHPVPPRVPFGRAGWEDDEQFAVERHIVRHRLARPGGQRVLADYIGSQIPVRLDPAHPMWQVHFLDGYVSGSAILFRMHHSIADGITLTRVLLSLTTTDDSHAGFTAPPPTRGPVEQVAGLGADLAGQAVRTVRDPARLVGAAGSTVRGARRLLHLATIPPKPPSALAGEVGPAKHVTWTEQWPLTDIKRIGRAAGVTVNDVLLSILADALSRYLVEEGTPLDTVRVMVPVNLRPLDQPVASDLGNAFGEYVVSLPTAPMAPRERLARMHAVVEELKDSPEAVVAYLTLVAIGWLPSRLEDVATSMFSGKVVATVSNVPGPKSQVRLAGTPVAGIIGWVPGAGDVGLGVSMFSYDDRVLMGVIADARLIPDLDRLSGHLVASLADLAAAGA